MSNFCNGLKVNKKITIIKSIVVLSGVILTAVASMIVSWTIWVVASSRKFMREVLAVM